MAFGSPLCTRTDTLRIAYGRDSGLDISGSIVDQAIEDATDEVFTNYGESRKNTFYVDSTHIDYEFRPVNVKTYRLEKVTVLDVDTNKRTTLSSTDYTLDLQTNKLTLTTLNATKWSGSYFEVDWVPLEWHLLAKNKAALNILDTDASQINPGENNAETPRVSRIAKRISRLEGSLMPVSCQGSVENLNYDVRTYDYINQDRFQTDPRY